MSSDKPFIIRRDVDLSGNLPIKMSGKLEDPADKMSPNDILDKIQWIFAKEVLEISAKKRAGERLDIVQIDSLSKINKSLLDARKDERARMKEDEINQMSVSDIIKELKDKSPDVIRQLLSGSA